MNRLITLLIMIGVVFTTSGCGGSGTKKFDDSMKPALLDFAQLLGSLPSDGIKPPKKLSEFLPLEPMAPISAEFIKNGEIVYFWGAGLKTGGQAIIAYEKKAEAAGGWVLLEDGSAKLLTSAEFAAAPKATKK